MTDDPEKAAEAPEEVTLRDLWRHLSGMEARLNQRFDAVESRFDDQGGQIEAIRQVVDSDMARHPDLVRLEHKVGDIAVDVRELRTRMNDVKGQVSKVQSRLDRGEAPV